MTRTIRPLAVGFAILWATAPVRADYDPTRFPELARQADLIVIGSVVVVSGADFELKVDDAIRVRGAEKATSGTSLKIQKFQDWECAARWSKYAVGQQLLLFLSRDHEDGHLRSIGAANEGEAPVQNGIAYFSSDAVPGRSYRYTVYARAFIGAGFPVDEVRQAIKDRRDLDAKKLVAGEAIGR